MDIYLQIIKRMGFEFPNEQQCSIIKKLIELQKFCFATSGIDVYELMKGISLFASNKNQQAPALNKQDISDSW